MADASRRVRKGKGSAIAALGLALAAPFAQAQEPTASFPKDAVSRPDVDDWVRRSLDLTGYLESGWSPNALFFASIRRINLDDFPLTRTHIWVEVISPEAERQAGWRSSSVELEVDCSKGRYRELKRTNFAAGGLKGVGTEAKADSRWSKPEPDTTMEATDALICRHAQAAMDLYKAR